MKSCPPILLAVFAAATLVASPAPAQNATPAPAEPGKIYFNTSGEGGPSYYTDLKPGETLSQFINRQPTKIRWVANAKLYLRPSHTPDNVPSTVVDYAAIANGQAPDVPLSANESIFAEPQPFVFPGGTPADLVKQTQDYFGVDWSIAVIPPEMRNVQVVQFRINHPSGTGEVLDLYNKLSDQVPALGQWFLQGDPYKPDVLLLVPDKSTTAAANPTPVAKALPVADIPKNQWPIIITDIRQADLASQQFTHPQNSRPSGELYFQDDSKILVVIGPPAFLDLAQSVVDAIRANQSKSLQLSLASPATVNNTTSPPPSPPPNPSPPN